MLNDVINELHTMDLVLIVIGIFALLLVLKENKKRFRSRYNPKPQCIGFDYTNKRQTHNDALCKGDCSYKNN